MEVANQKGPPEVTDSCPVSMNTLLLRHGIGGLALQSVGNKERVRGMITRSAPLPSEWLTRSNRHITPYKFISGPRAHWWAFYC